MNHRESAADRARALLKQLSLEEKLYQLSAKLVVNKIEFF